MRIAPLLLIAACADPATVRTAPLGPASGTPTAAGLPTGIPSGVPTGKDTGDGTPNGCPPHMARIDDPSAGDYCIDRFEAALQGWSPYEVPTGGQVAFAGPGEIPQGYVSGDTAAQACALAGKRLCTSDEWLRACRGTEQTVYPYGDTYDLDACNTERSSHPVVDLFGAYTDWSPTQMNDPGVNQQPDTVDPSGSNPLCVSSDGVYDLHGNLHEWVDDPSGVFRGGFYADAVLNGEGCLYATTAHTTPYHDYSTGFRCCSDP